MIVNCRDCKYGLSGNKDLSLYSCIYPYRKIKLPFGIHADFSYREICVEGDVDCNFFEAYEKKYNTEVKNDS